MGWKKRGKPEPCLRPRSGNFSSLGFAAEEAREAWAGRATHFNPMVTLRLE